MSDINDWAPARIWLQREAGEQGSHTWCEDSIDDCEQAEYVRADLVADMAEALQFILSSVNLKSGEAAVIVNALRKAGYLEDQQTTE